MLSGADEQDPLALIERRAREVALDAMENGWDGPPYDPFELADFLGIELVARQVLDDARLVSVGDRPRIEFNPARRPARVRFSIAHEIGHFLFPDFAQQVRYRDAEQRPGDDWQLEVLCNIAAAEFLMPAGAFPIAETENLSLPHLLDLRGRFEVSTEALLRRAVKLTDRSSCLFAAARLEDAAGFRVDYLVHSRSWDPGLAPGTRLPPTSVLHRCTAVGFADDAAEEWAGQHLHVQAVGVPPYPGDSFPRLVGLLAPTDGVDRRETGLRYVRGDASEPRAAGPAIVAHVVNDRARSWGGRGFAASLMQRFPDARDEYGEWASAGNARRGAVHVAKVAEQVWIASLVAQSGYGDAPAERPRLRLSALRQALESLAFTAQRLGADVHMPAIGTGQGGARWPNVRDLVLEELADRHVPVTVYVLPDAPMPEDTPVQEQLTLI
jgi:Zn-dependent peptidase ImmA (M78 family)/O-acetyl-ADP-ribose deacetylase (regulator of RNase III)